MNILKLSDEKLAGLLVDAKTEIARRISAAAADAGSIIKGQEMAKRALTIAVAGQHSLLFVGPPGQGKTMLRALALGLGLAETFEARYCPCGYFNDPMNDCCCTKAQVAKHRAKWPATDMTVEVSRLPFRWAESPHPGTSAAELRQVIENIAPVPARAPDLDENARVLLKAAVNELGFSTGSRETVLRIAATIARLDHGDRIGAAEMSEALNYRMMRP